MAGRRRAARYMLMWASTARSCTRAPIAAIDASLRGEREQDARLGVPRDRLCFPCARPSCLLRLPLLVLRLPLLVVRLPLLVVRLPHFDLTLTRLDFALPLVRCAFAAFGFNAQTQGGTVL